MGIINVTRKVGSQIFDFNVSGWIGYQNMKGLTKGLIDNSKDTFHVQSGTIEETFEEAVERLNLTEEILAQRKKEFTRLFLIFLITACCIFSYSIFIAAIYKNIMGFIMGLGITCYALSQSFKYHFWLYQIKAKKLGCSFNDWFNSKGVKD